MRENIEIQVWGKVNKIVKDNVEELNNSALKKVYQNADRCLFEIISENQDNCLEGNQRDAQVANVISFLGKRGRGKTSAMLSFHAYLEKLCDKNIPQWSNLSKLRNQKLVFHTIEYIDAAMLAENEFIIDVILAKMWDKFDNLLSKSYYNDKSEYLIKKVQDEFVRVRQAYLTMKYRETNFSKEIERERGIPAARGLHELATGVNLQESVKSLVEKYIQIFNNVSREQSSKDGYLVLAIDDVDMANDKAWNILEQIRMYMSIPNVIIFLTSDMERLREVCEISQNQKLSQSMISEFTNNYLEKVLPLKMRIYMPELMDNETDICIENAGVIGSEFKYEKEILLELIGKKYNLYFSGIRRKRHFMQNKSLRSLVSSFDNIKSLKEEEYGNWLKTDLQERLIERVHNKEDKFFLRSLFNKDCADINNYIVNYMIAKKEMENLSALAESSMGQVLYLCSLLEEKADYMDFVNCILLFYSLILKENKENSVLRKKIIGRSVLGGWEYAALTGKGCRTSLILGFQNRAYIEIDKLQKADIEKEGIVNIIKRIIGEQTEQILAWLYAMLYVDIQIPHSEFFQFKVKTEEKKESNTDGDKTVEVVKEVWRIQPYISCHRGLFSFLYKPFDEYKLVWELLLDGAITALYKQCLEECELKEGNEADLEQLLNEKVNILKQMESGESSDNDKLIDSTEILYCLGKILEEETQINCNDTDGQVEKLIASYTSVYKYLQEIDKYYKKIDIDTSFADNFKNVLQVRVVLEKNSINAGVEKKFMDYVGKIYRGSNVNLN